MRINRSLSTFLGLLRQVFKEEGRRGMMVGVTGAVGLGGVGGFRGDVTGFEEPF